MSVKKIFISLVLFAVLALTFVSCSGTKNICPAYSTSIETTVTAEPNS
ncbi:MAG: hypothetical protein JXA72_13520 [Bacteroidales bacterium]|nr:hypothetical protein [Bacteroidales bacterium]